MGSSFSPTTGLTSTSLFFSNAEVSCFERHFHRLPLAISIEGVSMVRAISSCLSPAAGFGKIFQWRICARGPNVFLGAAADVIRFRFRAQISVLHLGSLGFAALSRCSSVFSAATSGVSFCASAPSI